MNGNGISHLVIGEGVALLHLIVVSSDCWFQPSGATPDTRAASDWTVQKPQSQIEQLSLLLISPIDAILSDD